MLKFNQFLNESTWNKLIYHATFSDFNPKHIRQGSHFGSLQAAKDLANDKGLDIPHDAKLKVHAYDYKPSGNSREVSDGGDGEHFYRGMNIKGSKFQKFRKLNNITHLHYKNEYEHKGTTSHIIYDTHNLKHIHTFDQPRFIKKI